MEINSIAFKTACEKFQLFSSLGVTAEDHLTIGSTPPKQLVENPEKTLGELMSDQEIIGWIKGNEAAIADFSSEKNKNSSFAKSALSSLTKDLENGKNYLRSIGRL